ncbi:MAG: dephospho-CoA kinase [Bacteroidales bacterium]|nr:dephospho-CoA kinase [Bacteroidales bacterium]
MIVNPEMPTTDAFGRGTYDAATLANGDEQRKPLLVGLTGGIGCGKTTVAHMFQQLDVPCFVADEQAAKYFDDAFFLSQLRVLFGNKALSPNGKADKRAIANIVFNDHEKLLALNALVHPRVMKEFRDWALQQTKPYVIIESAILYEYGLDAEIDKVICVYLEQEERLRRLELRDHVAREALLDRMRNQLPAEEKMDRADYVILNYEGSLLRRQVKHINQLLTQQA